MGDTIQQAALHYKEGSSDKVYFVWLRKSDAEDGKFVVDFAFGRRGSTLNTGTKTNTPMSQYNASGVFDTLVRSKLEKGYQYTHGVPPEYSGLATVLAAKQTGIFPQLLNPIENDEECKEFISSDDWWMQEKKDGKRLIIRREGDEVVGINRRGLTCGIPDAIVDVMRRFPGPSIMVDGEAIGEVLHVFDLLEFHGIDSRAHTYLKRYDALNVLVGGLRADGKDSGVVFVPVFKRILEKKRVFAQMQNDNKEGVVFKQWAAAYTAGRPASGGTQRKYKFYATASVLVNVVNAQRSVGITVYKNGRSTEIGNVSIPVDVDIPKVGQVIEVRYLYAYKGGALAQPTYLGVRDDILENACTDTQLKYKADDEDTKY
jgi:bifunctional non-homologous end joining protein LigD